ncbi:MAG: hypothetical protein KTR32_02975 [Granulosicoccus sp.]|nr:hypothetical protein [Granulosicoccus sp.]
MTESPFADAESDPVHTDSYINVSGYRFVKLDYLPLLQADMLAALKATGVLGTILLATEGINIALAGTQQQIDAAKKYFSEDPRFANIWLKQSVSSLIPFAKLKIRIRHEIIAFDGAHAADRHLHRTVAPTVDPATLEQWLDTEKDIVLLDTRNDYEIESGSFPGAVQLDIAHFRDFKQAIKKALSDGKLDPTKPTVTFCTGGIRCEKAAPWMIEQGFAKVYQIDGGVLNYFEQTGGKHWQGDCFVFDDRVELDKRLLPTGSSWCNECQSTVRDNKPCRCQESKTAIDTV